MKRNVTRHQVGRKEARATWAGHYFKASYYAARHFMRLSAYAFTEIAQGRTVDFNR